MSKRMGLGYAAEMALIKGSFACLVRAAIANVVVLD